MLNILMYHLGTYTIYFCQYFCMYSYMHVLFIIEN